MDDGLTAEEMREYNDLMERRDRLKAMEEANLRADMRLQALTAKKNAASCIPFFCGATVAMLIFVVLMTISSLTGWSPMPAGAVVGIGFIVLMAWLVSCMIVCECKW